MTKSTNSAATDTAAVISKIPPSPEAAKLPRKRRMAREPGEVFAAAAAVSPTGAAEAPVSAPPPPASSKIAKVLALLRREDGATLDEMIMATGWLPHTTRAVLTGLRKKGHVIERAKRGEVTIWRITGEA